MGGRYTVYVKYLEIISEKNTAFYSSRYKYFKKIPNLVMLQLTSPTKFILLNDQNKNFPITIYVSQSTFPLSRDSSFDDYQFIVEKFNFKSYSFLRIHQLHLLYSLCVPLLFVGIQNHFSYKKIKFHYKCLLHIKWDETLVYYIKTYRLHVL